MCNKHYLRAWNAGTLDEVAPLPTSTERFWAKVDKSGNCWLWTAYTCPEGYGRFVADEFPSTLAHRIAYELIVGPIPEGLTIDHLCRNPSCVNPSHLEPVTIEENLRRAEAARVPVTHCKRGHPFDEVNTLHTRDGRRACRTCRRQEHAA